MHDKKLAELYERLGHEPPSTQSHGTAEDIRSNLKSVNPRNWRLEGNKLIADTDVGELVQYIPTTHILTGVGEDGLPIFKKVSESA